MHQLGPFRCVTVIATQHFLTRALLLTLSDEQAVTREAAMMKSRINMVAPGRPILKNLGLQCFMMVFTMSCRNNTHTHGMSTFAKRTTFRPLIWSNFFLFMS